MSQGYAFPFGKAASGPTGADSLGITGPAGATGIDGADGATGNPGSDGPVGPIGPQGFQSLGAYFALKRFSPATGLGRNVVKYINGDDPDGQEWLRGGDELIFEPSIRFGHTMRSAAPLLVNPVDYNKLDIHNLAYELRAGNEEPFASPGSIGAPFLSLERPDSFAENNPANPADSSFPVASYVLYFSTIKEADWQYLNELHRKFRMFIKCSFLGEWPEDAVIKIGRIVNIVHPPFDQATQNVNDFAGLGLELMDLSLLNFIRMAFEDTCEIKVKDLFDAPVSGNVKNDRNIELPGWTLDNFPISPTFIRPKTGEIINFRLEIFLPKLPTDPDRSLLVHHVDLELTDNLESSPDPITSQIYTIPNSKIPWGGL